jgi:putative oxidoreductase
VPALLLPAVIATETLGALAVALGWKTRIVAFLLAGYTLLTALLFHHYFSDPIQMLMFLKNVSIGGGFLLVLANGAGQISLDARRTK